MRASVSLPAVWLLVCSCFILSAGCSGGTAPASGPPDSFEPTVTPEVMNALPGERCVLLATVSGTGGISSPEPLIIGADCPGAEVMVEHPLVLPGEVAEVTVIPGARAPSQLGPGGPDPDFILTAVVTATRGSTVRAASVQLNILTGFEDQLAETAVELRDRFTDWLAENYPELGITPQTQWTGTMPFPVLVVEHYLFFNDDRELHLEWHMMIPPYDWARLQLRRRYEETAYSLAYEISSRSAEPPLKPVLMEPLNQLWR